MAAFKTLFYKPLSGPLDVRSLPDQMPAGGVRWRQNFWLRTDGRLVRAPQWQRFLGGEISDDEYNNADLHDQMLMAQVYYNDTASTSSVKPTSWPTALCDGELKTRDRGREHVTLLFEARAMSGSRRLIAGTQSRLYEFNYKTQAWRILADGMGGPARSDLQIRWRAAQVRDTIIFTNNYDPPMSYFMDAEPSGCAIRCLSDIPDVAKIKLEKANFITEFKGYIVLGDVVMDGQRTQERIIWFASNRPTRIDPSDPSIDSQYQDFPGERVMGLATMGDFLYVLTDRGIWIGETTNDVARPIVFTRRFRQTDGKRCLHYPNSLVCTGREIFYMGVDAIYRIDEFTAEPELTGWLHLASGIMFETLQVPCGGGLCVGYHPENDAVFISYPKLGDDVPQYTFMFQPRRQFASYMDFGATAFCVFSMDRRGSFRDDLMPTICGGDAYIDSFIKEGTPKSWGSGNQPMYIYSIETMTIDGLTTENWLAESPSDDSLIATWMNDEGECVYMDVQCQPCEFDKKFIFAHSGDYCIKEFGSAYSREVLQSVSGNPKMDGLAYTKHLSGTYRTDGYLSQIIVGPLDMGAPQDEKIVSAVTIDAEAGQRSGEVKEAVGINIGKHSCPVDPLWGLVDTTNTGGPIWATNPKWFAFESPNRMSPSEYREAHLAPVPNTVAPVLVVGNYIYVDIRIGEPIDRSNPNSEVVAGVNGSGGLSGFSLKTKRR